MLRYLSQPKPCRTKGFSPLKAFVLIKCPLNQSTVNQPESLPETRNMKLPIVIQPTPYFRNQCLRQLMNIHVSPAMKAKLTTSSHYASGRFTADRRTETEHDLSIFGDQFPGSECITQKVELLAFDLPFLAPAFAVAIDQTGLLGM